MKNIKDISKAFVHGGNFHADDVFATAVIKMINPHIEIIRGFNVPENFEGIVYDIGCGEFDHHQMDKRYRDNGVPYAAFGLIWEAYGDMLVDEEAKEEFDRTFIQGIDMSDNTGEPNHVSQIIFMMNPNWDEATDIDEAFDRAVEFAMSIMEKYIAHYNSERKAKEIVKEYISEDPVLVLPQYIPWKKAIEGRDIFYVVFPSNRGGYNVQAAPISSDTIELKKPFPQEWRGMTPEKLRQITGIESFSFCHTSGFMCAADTKEDAIEIAKQAYAC